MTMHPHAVSSDPATKPESIAGQRDVHGYRIRPSGMFRQHDPHRHRTYQLLCVEYDELIARSGRRCELCGRPEQQDEPWGRLYIDHDHKLGPWAVRGLLCNRCNSQLPKRDPLGPNVSVYLANAWHIGRKPYPDMGRCPRHAWGWLASVAGRLTCGCQYRRAVK